MAQYDLTPEELAAGAWLTSVLPDQYADRVYAADQRPPRLSHPFATFKFIDDVNATATARTQLRSVPGAAPDTFVREIREVRRVLLSVNVYGPTAYADIRRARLKMHDPSVVYTTRQAGLAVQFAGLVRRLPGDGNTTREDRAQCDFTAMYTDALDVEQQAVASATGTGTDDLTGLTITTALE